MSPYLYQVIDHKLLCERAEVGAGSVSFHNDAWGSDICLEEALRSLHDVETHGQAGKHPSMKLPATLHSMHYRGEYQTVDLHTVRLM